MIELRPRLSGAGFRRLAYWGARYGPLWWLRHSPGPIGRFVGRVSPRLRARARQLVEWSGQAGEASELRVFANYAHCLAEGLALPRRVLPEVELEGDGFPAGALVLLTGHTGSWEIAGATLARRLDRPFAIVMAPEPDPDARRLHERIRALRSVRTIYVGQRAEVGVRLLSEVRAGACLAFQMDRAAPSGRRFDVVLFGRRFGVPQGPFRIARLCQVPIVPVFNARVGFMKYRVRIYPELRLAADSDQSALAAAAQYTADCLQDFVRRYPGQWFHFEQPPPDAVR